MSIKRWIATGSATAFAAFGMTLVMAAPAVAGTYVNRVATVNPNPGVYEWITPDLRATAAGENLYIRFDRVPEAIYIRWVKCGHTSTQDAASSVGGAARYIAKNSDFGGALGTGFRNTSCVRIWARAAGRLSYRPSYPIEAYFDDHYHF